MSETEAKTARYGFLLRVGVFVLIAVLGLQIFPLITVAVGGYFVGAALSTFAAAAVANAVALRIYERGRLADVGLQWNAFSRRNLLIGVLGGMACGAVVILLPMALRIASFQHDPNGTLRWPSLLFVSLVLLFGAIGEELLFRGYAFQTLIKNAGAFATILPFSVIFAVLHMNNPAFTWLAFLNTALWGLVLGFSFLASGDLWLPIGLHFGWNWILPLLGVNLSGFTMGVTGYAVVWKTGELWSGGAYGPEGGLLTTVVIVALFFYVWRAPVRHQAALLLEQQVPDAN